MGPSVGVGAVLVHEGRVLLIRRGKEPLFGRWVIPGGTVERGESLEEALVREVTEETGLIVRPREVLAVFDRIQREGDAIQYHYVIIDYLCDYVRGSVRAGSDATEAAMVDAADLAAYDLPDKAQQVVIDALTRCGVAIAGGLSPGSEGHKVISSLNLVNPRSGGDK